MVNNMACGLCAYAVKVVRAGGFAEAEALMRAGAARKAADVLAKALHAQRACEYFVPAVRGTHPKAHIPVGYSSLHTL